MAEPDDQNLDDFFAKKDKTKKKTAKTSSRFTTDDIETQMEKKLKKKSLAKKKEKDATNSSKSSVLDVKVQVRAVSHSALCTSNVFKPAAARVL